MGFFLYISADRHEETHSKDVKKKKQWLSFFGSAMCHRIRTARDGQQWLPRS